AFADVIERGKLTCQIVGLGIGGRAGGNQPDAAGRHGHGRKRRDRLQPVEWRALDVVPEAQDVGEKNRIKKTGFRLLRQLRRIADVGQRQPGGFRVPPCGLMMSAALDEKIDVHAGHQTSPTCLDGVKTAPLRNAGEAAHLSGRPLESRRIVADGAPYTSTLALSELSWMNSRRGSTTSPISLVKMSSASSTSLILTCNSERASV